MSEVIEKPLTWDQVEGFLRGSEAKFEAADVDGLIARYDEDVVIRFADLPEIRGRAAARRYLEKRLKRQLGYKLRKELFAVSGQSYANSWTGSWTDAYSGTRMQGRGIEMIELREGRVVRIESVFNVWEEGREAQSRYFDPA